MRHFLQQIGAQRVAVMVDWLAGLRLELQRFDGGVVQFLVVRPAFVGVFDEARRVRFWSGFEINRALRALCVDAFVVAGGEKLEVLLPFRLDGQRDVEMLELVRAEIVVTRGERMADVVAIAAVAFLLHDAHVVVKQRAFGELTGLFVRILQTLLEGGRVDEQAGIKGVLEGDFAATVAPVNDALHHVRLKFLRGKAFDIRLEFGERFVKRRFIVLHHAFREELLHLEAFDERLRKRPFQKSVDEFDFLLEIAVVFQAEDVLGKIVGEAGDVFQIHGGLIYCKGLKGIQGIKTRGGLKG